MFNYKTTQRTEETRKALAISSTKLRGFVPTSGLMAARKQIGVLLVASITIVAAVSAGNVEFKHHNNTEMAEVLQQIHNR